MKANELRLGNYYEYRVIDKVANTDTWELTAIDIDDLKWLMKNPDYSMYRPIEITEKWLMRLGCKKDIAPYYLLPHEYESEVFIGEKLVYDTLYMELIVVQCDECGYSIPCRNVHLLQNIFFCLTRQELTINIEHNA